MGGKFQKTILAWVEKVDSRGKLEGGLHEVRPCLSINAGISLSFRCQNVISGFTSQHKCLHSG
jgi:hypothetical protein